MQSNDTSDALLHIERIRARVFMRVCDAHLHMKCPKCRAANREWGSNPWRSIAADRVRNKIFSTGSFGRGYRKGTVQIVCAGPKSARRARLTCEDTMEQDNKLFITFIAAGDALVREACEELRASGDLEGLEMLRTKQARVELRVGFSPMPFVVAELVIEKDGAPAGELFKLTARRASRN